jgi:hypothetical protein
MTVRHHTRVYCAFVSTAPVELDAPATVTLHAATFPARQYSVNGERRSFALLRPIADAASQERVRDLVLQAYAEYEETATEAAS